MFSFKKVFILLCTLFLTFVFAKTFLVDKVNLNKLPDKVVVNHVSSGVEKVKEKITLFLLRDRVKKVSYYEYLSERRIAELSYVVNNNQINLVEETASRYSTYIGTLVNYMVANNVAQKKDEVSQLLGKHRQEIAELQKKFEYDSGWWLAIQHDINTIDIFVTKMSSL